MNSIEKSMLLDELFALRKVDKAKTEQLLSLDESLQVQTKIIDELKQVLLERNMLIEKTESEKFVVKKEENNEGM